MNYLVTGAAGFIGANLTSQLLKSGHQLDAVDNFSQYYSVGLKRARVQALLDIPGFNIQPCDLRDKRKVENLFNNRVYDAVIHLAAQPGVRLPKNQYGEYVSNNLVAFENILSATVENKVPNFLYASSSSVYGNSAIFPYAESEKGLAPISFYGATKLANEIFAHPLIANSETRARGLRFFTVYGAWGRPDMAYFRIIGNALVNSPFTVFGDGAVVRDFTYIDDVVDSIIALISELKNHPAGFSDVVNVGGGNPISLNQLIIEISQQLDTFQVFPHGPSDLNDVSETNADTKYLVKLIGRHPSTTLEEGISQVIKWAKSPEVRSNLNSWTKSVY